MLEMNVLLVGDYQEEIPGVKVIDRQDIVLSKVPGDVKKQIARLCQMAKEKGADGIIFQSFPRSLLIIFCFLLASEYDFGLEVGYMVMDIPEDHSPRQDSVKFEGDLGIRMMRIIKPGLFPLEFRHVKWFVNR